MSSRRSCRVVVAWVVGPTPQFACIARRGVVCFLSFSRSSCSSVLRVLWEGVLCASVRSIKVALPQAVLGGGWGRGADGVASVPRRMNSSYYTGKIQSFCSGVRECPYVRHSPEVSRAEFALFPSIWSSKAWRFHSKLYSWRSDN